MAASAFWSPRIAGFLEDGKSADLAVDCFGCRILSLQRGSEATAKAEIDVKSSPQSLVHQRGL